MNTISKKCSIQTIRINICLFLYFVKKGDVKMNEKSTLTMLHLETGELKEFSGYWSWKEIYQMVKQYEKSEQWKILKIEKQI